MNVLHICVAFAIVSYSVAVTEAQDRVYNGQFGESMNGGAFAENKPGTGFQTNMASANGFVPQMFAGNQMGVSRPEGDSLIQGMNMDYGMPGQNIQRFSEAGSSAYKSMPVDNNFNVGILNSNVARESQNNGEAVYKTSAGYANFGEDAKSSFWNGNINGRNGFSDQALSAGDGSLRTIPGNGFEGNNRANLINGFTSSGAVGGSTLNGQLRNIERGTDMFVQGNSRYGTNGQGSNLNMNANGAGSFFYRNPLNDNGRFAQGAALATAVVGTQNEFSSFSTSGSSNNERTLPASVLKYRNFLNMGGTGINPQYGSDDVAQQEILADVASKVEFNPQPSLQLENSPPFGTGDLSTTNRNPAFSTTNLDKAAFNSNNFDSKYSTDQSEIDLSSLSEDRSYSSERIVPDSILKYRNILNRNWMRTLPQNSPVDVTQPPESVDTTDSNEAEYKQENEPDLSVGMTGYAITNSETNTEEISAVNENETGFTKNNDVYPDSTDFTTNYDIYPDSTGLSQETPTSSSDQPVAEQSQSDFLNTPILLDFTAQPTNAQPKQKGNDENNKQNNSRKRKKKARKGKLGGRKPKITGTKALTNTATTTEDDYIQNDRVTEQISDCRAPKNTLEEEFLKILNENGKSAEGLREEIQEFEK